MHDILIKNGRIVDPANGRDEIGAIGIVGNRIVQASEADQGDYTIDASGCLVIPGLIDAHAHFFRGGSSHGIVPDMQVANGVTTVNDAGSVGAANFEAYYRSVVTQSTIRMYTGLHIYPMGQPGYGLCEDLEPCHYPRKDIAHLLERYPDQIRSMKIRIGEEIVGPKALDYLKSAVSYCDELGLPLVVHASNTPCTAEEVADVLRPNDVFCHCFHGKKNPIIDKDEKIFPGVLNARKRGVIFDCCNGKSNFATRIGKAVANQNFFPDIISTDMIPDYYNRNGFAKSLPYLMSKYLELGMPLYEVVRAVTATPAKWLRTPELGTLEPGSLADIAIFKLIDSKTCYLDIFGEQIVGHKLFKPQMTILDGEIVYAQIDF